MYNLVTWSRWSMALRACDTGEKLQVYERAICSSFYVIVSKIHKNLFLKFGKFFRYILLKFNFFPISKPNILDTIKFANFVSTNLV